jgi:UDP-glucose 4-epimerase
LGESLGVYFNLDKSNPVLVTGCAGFIGSNLIDDLLRQGFKVIGLDNFETGKKSFIKEALANKNFTFHEVDLLRETNLVKFFNNCELVFHLAANADVRFGVDKPGIDFDQNTHVTFKVLEAMRISGVTKICFSSTGSIYGEANVIPTPENAPFPIQTSLYGASKLACEGMISAYCETFGFQAWIFRFVSILGPRYTHGHVFDFYKQLLINPGELKVLGDGNQKKSYLHVFDGISGIQSGIKNFNDKVNIMNLGSNKYITVKESVNLIKNTLNISPNLKFGIKDRGWIGDNPFIFLETKKMNSIGWTPRFSIEQGIEDTIKYLKENLWLFSENKNF